jgi:cystathionine gamma-synthase
MDARARPGLESDAQFGAVIPPIYLTTNFAFESVGRPRQYEYSRSGNPTRDQLAAALAELEGGAGAVVTCTGLAAITLILATLPTGARILAPHDCYGGTFRLLTALQRQGALRVDFVDQTDTGATQAALAARPQLVWIETPSNPLLRIVDIQALSAAAHASGALVVADNTFLSPVWQQPLSLGADLVMHSTTKYLNGHSDLVGGAVIAGSPELNERLGWWANALGVTGAPFDSFLTLRGIRSLHARMRVHAENAQAIVGALRGSAAVGKVFTRHLGDANLQQVVQWFEMGGELKVPANASSAELLGHLKKIQGLFDNLEPLGVRSKDDAALQTSAAEFILEGLWAHKRISRSEERGFFAEARKTPEPRDPREPAGGGRMPRRQFN